MINPTSTMHMQGTFYILKKRCKVILTDNGISWEPEGSPECKYISVNMYLLLILKRVFTCFSEQDHAHTRNQTRV